MRVGLLVQSTAHARFVSEAACACACVLVQCVGDKPTGMLSLCVALARAVW